MLLRGWLRRIDRKDCGAEMKRIAALKRGNTVCYRERILPTREQDNITLPVPCNGFCVQPRLIGRRNRISWPTISASRTVQPRLNAKVTYNGNPGSALHASIHILFWPHPREFTRLRHTDIQPARPLIGKHEN